MFTSARANTSCTSWLRGRTRGRCDPATGDSMSASSVPAPVPSRFAFSKWIARSVRNIVPGRALPRGHELVVRHALPLIKG
jgi:hypothetical protein